MNNRIDWFCPYLAQIKFSVEFLVEFTHDSTVFKKIVIKGIVLTRHGEKRTYYHHEQCTNQVQLVLHLHRMSTPFRDILP